MELEKVFKIDAVKASWEGANSCCYTVEASTDGKTFTVFGSYDKPARLEARTDWFAGKGIEAKYIPTAFIRHATSKIRTEDDLTHIHTLGFRGEALASIASVARVEVLTRTADAECASVYHIEGGEEQPMEPGARGVGTTIRVRDLFYNTPARMKFLKKDSSEGSQLQICP